MRTLLITLVITAPLFAGDVWKEKKPSEWSAEDAKRVVTKSPWAKEAPAQMNVPGSIGGPGLGGAMPGPEMGGGMGGGMPGGDVGMSGPGMGGRMPRGGGGADSPSGNWQLPKFTVAWESAAPIREARARLEQKLPPKAAFPEFYVVSVSGFPKMGRQPDPTRSKDKLLESTALLRKNKDAIRAVDVEFATAGGAAIMLFYFPRGEAIDPAEKEVAFETQMGPMKVKAKFSPKEMAFDGKPAI